MGTGRSPCISTHQASDAVVTTFTGSASRRDVTGSSRGLDRPRISGGIRVFMGDASEGAQSDVKGAATDPYRLPCFTGCLGPLSSEAASTELPPPIVEVLERSCPADPEQSVSTTTESPTPVDFPWRLWGGSGVGRYWAGHPGPGCPSIDGPRRFTGD